MTPTHKRTVRLSSDVSGRRRAIVVIVGPGSLLGFREHGTRKVYETTAGACYSLAVKQHVAAVKAAKLAARKARKAGHV
jgi:hypothetical protein